MRGKRHRRKHSNNTVVWIFNLCSIWIKHNMVGPDSTTGQPTFHWSHVDVSILKGRDEHSDMNEVFHHKNASHWIETSTTACKCKCSPLHKHRKNLAYLVDYAVYQLCMKQLHTGALGLGWKPNGWIPSTIPPSTLSTCPFINPAGRPFVCANIRLAVCLSVCSAVEVFLFSAPRDISVLWPNL